MRDHPILNIRSLPASLLLLAILFASEGADARVCTHRVLPGDTPSGLAQTYDTSSAKICARNKGRCPLKIGSRLKIRTRRRCQSLRRRHYRVRRGDTLSEIASKFKMKLMVLRGINPKTRGRPLKIGERLWVLSTRPTAGASRSSGRGRRRLRRLGTGPGYRVRNANRAWATGTTRRNIKEVAAIHMEAYPDAGPLKILDISKRGGGRFPPHVSHRYGRDVDILFPGRLKRVKRRRCRKKRCRKLLVSRTVIDLERTWFVITSLIDAGDVQYIFLGRHAIRQLYRYAARHGATKKELREMFHYRGKGNPKAPVRYSKGHVHHFHVRFNPDKPDTAQPTT